MQAYMGKKEKTSAQHTHMKSPSLSCCIWYTGAVARLLHPPRGGKAQLDLACELWILQLIRVMSVLIWHLMPFCCYVILLLRFLSGEGAISSRFITVWTAAVSHKDSISIPEFQQLTCIDAGSSNWRNFRHFLNSTYTTIIIFSCQIPY